MWSSSHDAGGGVRVKGEDIAMQATEHRSFQTTDETRAFPIAGTNSCEAPHFQYHVSGRLAIRMDDGTEFVAGPGDITSLPSGHDAWVVGDEPVVTVDWFGATNYAK
jgi:hypothetical protein